MIGNAEKANPGSERRLWVIKRQIVDLWKWIPEDLRGFVGTH